MEYEIITTIHAPLATVWETLMDVARWPQWTASVQWAKVAGGSGGGAGLAVGTRARIKQPRLPVAVWQVTELTPNRSFTWQARSAGLTTAGGHRLAAGPEGSTVSVHSLRLTGALAPLAGRALAGLIRRSLQLEADGLKRHCEAL